MGLAARGGRQLEDERVGTDPVKLHGYIGFAIILTAEVLLFSGNTFVGHWFTPIVWTGYILFIDAIVFRVDAGSLLVTDRVELLIIICISVGGWWLFEFYNAPRFWRSDQELWWHYHNLELNPYLRSLGFTWAFATISPAMLLTAQLLATSVFGKLEPAYPVPLSRIVLHLMIAMGAVGVVVPLIFLSAWLAPVVWLSFIFLLDPINYLRGWPSIVGDLRRGNHQRLFALLAAGGVCGILWEFWNYWAISKWTYTVPYLGNVKLFEMPLLGYFGFPPFAVECWVMYIFFRSLITRSPVQTGKIWIESSP